MSILLALGGESDPRQTALVADRLARSLECSLNVLHVMPTEQAERRIEEHRDYYFDDAAEDAASIAESALPETVRGSDQVSVRGRVGDPVEEILEAADRADADYIVLGGRKRTKVGKAIFGSVTQSVLLSAKRPVITVPRSDYEHDNGDTGPVVAAVDRSERAKEVVSGARDLAVALDRELHVVHVGSSDGSREAEAVAEDATASISGDHTSVGLVGDPSVRLIEYATNQDAGYVVVKGRKRSPIGKVLFGSVTQAVLLGTDRPVLSLP